MVTTWLLDETPGHTPLWQVFWIYGVLVSHLLFGSILYLFRVVDTPALALMLAGFVLPLRWRRQPPPRWEGESPWPRIRNRSATATSPPG